MLFSFPNEGLIVQALVKPKNVFLVKFSFSSKASQTEKKFEGLSKLTQCLLRYVSKHLEYYFFLSSWEGFFLCNGWWWTG